MSTRVNFWVLGIIPLQGATVTNPSIITSKYVAFAIQIVLRAITLFRTLGATGSTGEIEGVLLRNDRVHTTLLVAQRAFAPVIYSIITPW